MHENCAESPCAAMHKTRSATLRLRELRSEELRLSEELYAQTLIVVVLIVVNFFGFLVIAPYPTMRF